MQYKSNTLIGQHLKGPTQAEQLKERTKQFAIHIVELFRLLPRREEALVIGKQALRSGTSVAANYRAACRARSRNEFVAKMGVVVEEIDETVFWIEMVMQSHVLEGTAVETLLSEAKELLAIFAASQRTARLPMARCISG